MTLDFDSLVSYSSVMEHASEPLFTIGEVAERANVSRRTVRYYVQRGLIDAPIGRGRGSAYSQKHIEQIQRVLRLQREGLALQAIEQLPAGQEPTTQNAVMHSLLVRVPLGPGVNLEIDAGHALPDQQVLNRLAAACRQILNDEDADEANEAAADAAEGGSEL
jgi:DNA-binding transcriptional MerR regulator